MPISAAGRPEPTDVSIALAGAGRRANGGRRRAASVVVAAAAAAAAGCTPKPAPTAWNVDSLSVTGPARARVDSARVDIYVDATVSMGGYVTDRNSRYAQFLERLESAAQTTWPRADVHFYRFGQQPQEVGRAAFLSARFPAFYTEKITGIDRAVDCPDPRVVRVIVTDLYQSDGDVNAIVAQLKARCFQRGRSAAVLGARSQFDGRVYDARVAPYVYTSAANQATYRPFYALVLGDPGAVEPLLAALSERTLGERLPYVTVGPTVVRRYGVAMRKAPNTREFNPPTAAGPYGFGFTLNEGHAGGAVLADLAATFAPGAPPVAADQLELVSYRRAVGRDGTARPDSTESSDVKLQRIRQEKDSLHLALLVTPPDAPGTYAYKLALRAAGSGGFAIPAWVDQYSSSNPSPASDANKTLNLASFVGDMRRAASSVAPPRVAVWYMTVRRR